MVSSFHDEERAPTPVFRFSNCRPAMTGRSPRLLHPFLFAVAPILFIFAHNAHELPLFEQSTLTRLLLPCAVSLSLTWLLWLFLRHSVVRDRLLAGVTVSLLLFLFFGFGHAQGIYIRTVEQLGGDLRYVVQGIKIGHFKIFFAFWTVGGLAAAWGLGRWLLNRCSRLPGLTIFLNRMAVILVLMALIQIGWIKVTHSLQDQRMGKTKDLQVTNRAGNRPDIYYIILDSYAASRTLRDSYQFNNRDFLYYLRNKGFYVAERSHSNYTSTLMSLVSSLNFEHFNYLSDTMGRKSTNISQPMRMVENSKVMRFLKASGYSFVNFKTPIGPAFRNRHADWDIDCDHSLVTDDFLKLMIATTLLEPFFRSYNTKSQRERILCQLAMLPRLNSRPGLHRPLFVFAHILCPHYPYVFGRDGQPPGGTSGRHAPVKQLYVDQLIFLNRLVMKMLDDLLASSAQPPVVILQGDHGPTDHPVQSIEEAYKNRTRILNAYLLPGNGACKLYDSITPVNTFRLILNHYFGTAFPLVEDRTFYADPLDKSLYNIQEVTDVVRDAE